MTHRPSLKFSTIMTLVCALCLSPFLLLSTTAATGSTETAPAASSVRCSSSPTQNGGACIEDEDIAGFEAVRSIHLQLDDDADGEVDTEESDEFLREELNYASGGYDGRLAAFHESADVDGDGRRRTVSVRELWRHWRRSTVHNWTAEETRDWLVWHVQLPQYSDAFQQHSITGRHIPRMAVNNNHYLSSVLGVKDPRHKQKIMLKAMDAVLFGPPKDGGNWVKDTVLLSLVVVSCVGCWLVHRQNAKFQLRMRKMAADMENLNTAEKSLCELQRELDRANEEKEAACSEKRHLEQCLSTAGTLTATTGTSGESVQPDYDETAELSRLRAEVEILREALHSAERQLDGCSTTPSGGGGGGGWNTCPPSLQHWLQLTYELELRAHTARRRRVEQQLAAAKTLGDKLRRKQTSVMGVLVSMHGRAVNDFDASIATARRALLDVTAELQERTYRWRQVELICGLNVVHNPGLPYLLAVSNSLRATAAGTPLLAHSASTLGSSLGRTADDLVDEDDSISAVMTRQSAAATQSGATSVVSSPSCISLPYMVNDDQLMSAGQMALSSDACDVTHDANSSITTALSVADSVCCGGVGGVRLRVCAGGQGSGSGVSGGDSSAANPRRAPMLKSLSQEASGSPCVTSARLTSQSDSALNGRTSAASSVAAAAAAAPLSERVKQLASCAVQRVEESDESIPSSSSCLASEVEAAEDAVSAVSSSSAADKRGKRKFHQLFRRPKTKAM